MQRIILLLLAAALCSGVASANNNPSQFGKNGNDRFSIKIQPFMGTYMAPNSSIKDMNPNGPTGINFGIEFPSSQQHPWQ